MISEDPEQVRLLREILKWIRFSGMKEVKGALVSTLDSEQKKLIYQLSDGSNSSVDISKIVGVSDWTVRSYWKTWARAGIVEPIKAGKGDRFKRSFDLNDFGISASKQKDENNGKQEPPGTEAQQESGQTTIE